MFIHIRAGLLPSFLLCITAVIHAGDASQLVRAADLYRSGDAPWGTYPQDRGRETVISETGPVSFPLRVDGPPGAAAMGNYVLLENYSAHCGKPRSHRPSVLPTLSVVQSQIGRCGSHQDAVVLLLATAAHQTSGQAPYADLDLLGVTGCGSSLTGRMFCWVC